MIRRSTWIIVLIFAALLAGTIYWQRVQKPESAKTTPTPTVGRRYLFDLAGKIVFIRLDRVNEANSNQIELQRDAQDNWLFTWPTGAMVDRNALDPALSQLAALSVLSTMPQPPALDVLGLDKPTYRLLLKLEDASQIVVNIGKETPTGSGYYILSGDRQIYIVDKISMDGILKLIDSPPILLPPTSTETEMPETPTP